MNVEAASRPKLGIIFPNDPIESEMHRLDRWLESRGCNDITAATRFSSILGGHNEADLLAMGGLEAIAPAGCELAAEGCGAVIWGCTSASFIGGLGWAKEQAAGLAEATGLPASNTTLAFVAALETLQVRRVQLLAAYPEPVARAFIDCLAAAGVTVVSWWALDMPDGASSFRLALAKEAARFVETLPAGDETPILIPDTAINSLDRVAALEAQCGRPVLTANQVTLWQGLRLLGVEPAIAGAGSLLATSSRAALVP